VSHGSNATTLVIAGAAATGAIVAAGVAIWQARIAAKASEMQMTFAHLRAVTTALNVVRPCDPNICRDDILAFYKPGDTSLSGDGQKYLDLLNELDLLGLAFRLKAVNCKAVLQYVKGHLVKPDTVPIDFIIKLRVAAEDSTTYEDLLHLITTARDDA
jgi:hypothetical protein